MKNRYQPRRPVLSRRFVLNGLGAVVAASALPRATRAEIVDFVAVGKDDWLFAIYDENKHFDPAHMRTVTGCINDAVAIMKKAGIETAIALTPSKSRVYRDYLPADFMPIPEIDKRYALARETLSKPGTLVPDLASVMLDLRRTNPGEAYFLKADTHWTADGAEPCAIEMAKQIKARNFLPPSPKQGSALGPITTVKQAGNDLAEGLPDARAVKYGPQAYHIHQVAQVSGAAGLLDDGAADVLLVGNSFMQPKYGFAPMLSSQLGRPVSLMWKVHQSSPYKTLLQALGSDQFRKQKPKLLVWDFEETDMGALPDRTDVWGPNALKIDAFLSQLHTTVEA